MRKQISYELTADVTFTVADGVDIMYWINPDTDEKQHRMDGIYSHVVTEDDIYEHLAYNAVFNGVEDASRLDGWADLNWGDLTMRVYGRIEGTL